MPKANEAHWRKRYFLEKSLHTVDSRTAMAKSGKPILNEVALRTRTIRVKGTNACFEGRVKIFKDCKRSARNAS